MSTVALTLPRLVSPAMGTTSQASDYTAFVAAHQQALLGFSTLVCGDADAAQDVLQNVLARAYLKWDRIGADDMDTRAYLNRMIVNERNSLWRRAVNRHESSTDRVPQGAAQAAHEHDSTWDEVLKLPPRQRQVIALRFYADMSVEQTAAALRCSVGTVKSQTHHAITNLRRAMGTASWATEGQAEHGR